MSDLIKTIDLLEDRLQNLLHKFSILSNENQNLRADLKKGFQQITALQTQIDELEEQNKNLRAANAILGSKENKKETKLKINSLIKEIDQCIVQLSE